MDSWSRPEQGGGIGQYFLQEAEPSPVRPWMEGQAKPQGKLLTLTAYFLKPSTFPPPMRATVLLGPSILIGCSHLSVLLIKHSIAKLLLGASPSPCQSRAAPWSNTLWSSLTVLIALGIRWHWSQRAPNPHSLGIMLHFNLSSIKTQKPILPSGRKINSFLFQYQGMYFVSYPRVLIKGHDPR